MNDERCRWGSVALSKESGKKPCLSAFAVSGAILSRCTEIASGYKGQQIHVLQKEPLTNPTWA